MENSAFDFKLEFFRNTVRFRKNLYQVSTMTNSFYCERGPSGLLGCSLSQPREMSRKKSTPPCAPFLFFFFFFFGLGIGKRPQQKNTQHRTQHTTSQQRSTSVATHSRLREEGEII